MLLQFVPRNHSQSSVFAGLMCLASFYYSGPYAVRYQPWVASTEADGARSVILVVLNVGHTLSYLHAGRQVTLRRGWLRAWRCHIMWGSISPKSSRDWIGRIWSGRWRRIIFPTSATIAGRRNNKVCSGKTIKKPILILIWPPSYVFHGLFLFSPTEEGMLYRARYFGDTDLYQRAQRARTPSCAKLSEITASLHGWGCFHNQKQVSRIILFLPNTFCSGSLHDLFHSFIVFLLLFFLVVLQVSRINTQDCWL